MPQLEEATLTRKNQVTVPKAVREALGIVPGDEVRFVPAWHGFRLVVIKGDITAMRGVLEGRRSKSLAIGEMNQAIAGMGCDSETGSASAPSVAKARRR